MELPSRKSRTGTFRAKAKTIEDRIREGRSSHRSDELPRPRPSGQRTGRPPDSGLPRFRPARPRSARAAPQSRDAARDGRKAHREDELPRQRARDYRRIDKDRRKEISLRVSTRSGAVCGFSYACRHGNMCRGIHSESEKVLFRQRDRRVAALEREAGCAYCRAGICRYGAKCKGQTAMRAKNRTVESKEEMKLPEPRKLIRKRGRRRPRGKRDRAGGIQASTGVKSHRCDSQEYDESFPVRSDLKSPATATSDTLQEPPTHTACQSNHDHEEDCSWQQEGSNNSVSEVLSYNGFRVSELTADIQRAMGVSKKAGVHTASGQRQASGGDQQGTSENESNQQQQQDHQGGFMRNSRFGFEFDSDDSLSNTDNDSDDNRDNDSGSYSDSSSDSRQCCADLQMMIQVPRSHAEMMAQRGKESQCFEEGAILFHGVWFCRDHAPYPSRKVHNQNDNWECNSADPSCEQPGCTLHGGLWFCKDHALLEAPAQSIADVIKDILIDGTSFSTRSGRVLGIAVSYLLWLVEAHWGWSAAFTILVMVMTTVSEVKSRRRERQQLHEEARVRVEERQQRAEEASDGVKRAVMRSYAEKREEEEYYAREAYDY